ncbi:Alpha/Beta hydrolase protein [Pseudoneurospora amorphoporcata]|uniref:Alpha/Beta hydrolase protein n=1 Tax=Pseudoneurospora amorphoporcata TaxID=241081 RepID=A0AAN6SGB5_9PEZI|nr:Alpha/Beta hydrolase protein [Pseudoneurospora amorphoporcata]
MHLVYHLCLFLLLLTSHFVENVYANPLAVPADLNNPQGQRLLASLHDHATDTSTDGGAHTGTPPAQQSGGVSLPFFASLERMARLVDITYCVGTTGVSKPFSCVSRCKDFPTLRLERTWNTGLLLSDSCGYLAVDHGERRRDERTGRGVVVSDPAIIVAFRGTYSITNTIVDLSTVPQEYVPYPAPDDDEEGDEDGDGNVGKEGSDKKDDNNKCTNCTVHMGFLASWRSARDYVLPALKAARAKHPDYPVHLVGHSLGGAVAALAALEIRLSLGWQDVQVTTFGEPRIGNQALVGYLDKAFGLDNEDDEVKDEGEKRAYRRVTHVNDPVPLLPLTEWGYRSHAGEVYISKSDLPPAPEDLRLCRGDNDPECMAGAERSDGGGWFDGGTLQVADLLALAAAKGVDRDLYYRDPVAVGVVDGDDGEDGGDADDAGNEDVDVNGETTTVTRPTTRTNRMFPARLKLWQLFFAHRDYFWRLGLCVPGGDPTDWGRDKYNLTTTRESFVLGDGEL